MSADNASRRNLSPGVRKGAHRAVAPGTARRRINRLAIDRTIAYLKRTDRLTPGDDGTIALLRTTALALDGAEGAYDTAMIARVHLAAVGVLLSGHPVPSNDDDFATLRAILRGA